MIAALALVAALVPALVTAPRQQGDRNRLWLVEVELRGPCESVRLDCGPDGETRLAGPFSGAEERRLRLAVPVRAPLGAAGLAALPLPRAELVPADAAGTVRVVGWSVEQPAERLARVAGAGFEGARPPVSSSPPRAHAPELLLVLASGALLARLRRRPLACASLALALALAVFALARSRTGASPTVRVVAWEAGDSSAVEVRARAGELELPCDALEATPDGTPLVLELARAGTEGVARAPAGRLFAFASAAVPALTAARNDGDALAEVWTRGAGGEWRAHGPWPAGTPLGAATVEAGADPPGWLASGLPPGLPALLGRTAGGVWLRCLGFESP